MTSPSCSSPPLGGVGGGLVVGLGGGGAARPRTTPVPRGRRRGAFVRTTPHPPPSSRRRHQHRPTPPPRTVEGDGVESEGRGSRPSRGRKVTGGRHGVASSRHVPLVRGVREMHDLHTGGRLTSAGDGAGRDSGRARLAHYCDRIATDTARRGRAQRLPVQPGSPPT